MTISKNYPPIRVHGIFGYDRGAKARWLLTELDIPYSDRWMSTEVREFEQPEYLAKLNPMGRVPVVEIGDTVMFESNAIAAYLADNFGIGRMAPALDSWDRASYQKWMYFAAASIDVLQTRIMVIEDIPAGEVATAKWKALLEDTRDVMVGLDSVLAKNEYLVANQFSAADICVGYHLYWLTLWPEFLAIIGEFPKIGAYLERMKKRPAAIKAGVFTFEE